MAHLHSPEYNKGCLAFLIMCDIYSGGTSSCFAVVFHGSMTISPSTLTKMTEWAIMGESSSRWQQTASSLHLHINGVISEHSVRGESVNKMGQATLEACYWLTSISLYPGALFPYYYREPLDKQINKQLPLGSDTRPSDDSTWLLLRSSVEVCAHEFIHGRWTFPSSDICCNSCSMCRFYTCLHKAVRKDYRK